MLGTSTGLLDADPTFLEPVHDRIRWDDAGRPDVHRHYAIDHAGKEIYLQNGEVHVDVERDSGLLHDWVTRPYAGFWGMQDASPDDVRHAYADIAASAHHHAWLGRVDGAPAFLCETYEPAHSPLAAVHDVRPGDVGMHVLVGPPSGERLPGYTRSVMVAVMEHCFADPTVRRVVVEPDVRNTRIHALNAAVGFVVVGEVELPDKTALLSVCRRSEFVAAVAA